MIKSLRDSRWLAAAAVVIALVCFSPARSFGQTWNGSVSNDWFNGANWTPGTIPNSSSAVVDILSATNNPVMLGASASVSTLTLGSAASLDVTAGLLAVFGTSIANAGSIALSTQWQLDNAVTLSGIGTLTMATGGEIGANNSGGQTLTNSSTIQGTGLIGSNNGSLYQNLSLANSGTIDANSSGNTLTISGTGSSITNSGLLEATGGGILNIATTSAVNDSGGHITASGANSTVEINTTIQGGTLKTTGGGILESGATAVLDASTQGAITLVDGSTYTAGSATVTSVTGALALGTSTGSTLALGGQLKLVGDTTLSGPGTVTMNAGEIGADSSSGRTLTNQVTIQGSGLIGSNTGALYETLSLNNSGTINANSSTNTLTIGGNGPTITNSGLLEATSGGILAIATASPVNNSGGHITASGAGSTVEIGTGIEGGTLTTASGGVMETVGTTTLDGTTQGAITLANGTTYTAPATTLTKITGTLNLNTGSNMLLGGTLQLDGNTTLAGPGSLTITGGAGGAQIGTNSTAYTLTNHSLIQGSGTIGSNGANVYPNLSLANTGTIDANSSGNALVIAGSGTVTNTGLMEATGGGRLHFTATHAINNSTGTITSSGHNSLVEFSTSVEGGTLTTTGGGVMESNGTTAALNGASVGAITLSDGSAYNAPVSTLTKIVGALKLGTSTGSTVTLDGQLQLTGNTTLSGPGSVVMTGGQIGGNGTLYTLTNDSRILGSGVIGSNTGSLYQLFNLTNAGTVDANQSGATLTVAGTGTVVNNGLMEATGGATLDVTVVNPLKNTNGTITASGSGSLVEIGSATIQGGTLTTTGGGAMETVTGATLDGITNGAITLSNGSTYTAPVGTLTQITGTLKLGTTSGSTLALPGLLQLTGNTTLSGPGSLTMTSSGPNTAQIGTNGPIYTLTNQSTIQGAGLIGSNVGSLFDDVSLTNSGTVNATGGTLTIAGNGTTSNTGTMAVQSGSTLDITTAFSNFNSGTGTLTGGTYNVTGTFQFGVSGTTLHTNAASISMIGASAKMIDAGNNNILLGFNNNASTGVFKLTGGATLTTTAGNFTNAGIFTVGTGSVFTIGGSTFNYTQTAGTTTVNGTLTSSTLGTVSVNGGSLFGTGTVGDNVVDASTLRPGLSATSTGRLTVADTYTQSAAGALDISIDGATVVTQYDQLKVTQGATLGGTLNVALGSGFTPALGAHFVILTASSVGSTFATVNGLAINGSEHFVISYQPGSVVLTVVSGALAAASPAASPMVTQLIHPGLHQGSGVKGHYGPEVFSQRIGRLSAIGPAALPAPLRIPGVGLRGFRPMDQFGSPAALAAPAGSTGDASGPGSLGIAPVSAASYNSMSAMNHMRFECGVDLKALLKTSRKQLWKGLWAAPDSPDALAIGYMNYTGTH